MSNIDDFNVAAAVILDKLYTTFPRRISLRDDSFDSDRDEATLMLYRDTILFLQAEGILRYVSWSNGKPIYFEGVALTARGLAILNSTPDALKEKVPLGVRLSTVLKSGSGEALKVLINQIVSAAVSAASSLPFP
jgi:hypothetical protein